MGRHLLAGHVHGASGTAAASPSTSATADGPAFEGRAEWVDDRPGLEDALFRDYRRKYWLTVPLFMIRYIRRRLVRKTSVLIRITPATL